MVRWTCSLLAAGLVVAMLPAASPAAPVGFALDDPAGDVAEPALDIRRAFVNLDTSHGRLDIGAELGAAPTIAVTDRIEFALGRFRISERGACAPVGTYADIRIPTPEDVDDGLPWPYGLLLRDKGDQRVRVGFLISGPQDNRLSATSTHADAAVVRHISRLRANCVTVSSVVPESLATADTLTAPLLAPGPVPACTLRPMRVKRARPLRLHCTHSKGRVTVRLFESGRNSFLSVRGRFKRGRLVMRPARSIRGTFRVTVWKRDTVIAAFNKVRIG